MIESSSMKTIDFDNNNKYLRGNITAKKTWIERLGWKLRNKTRKNFTPPDIKIKYKTTMIPYNDNADKYKATFNKKPTLWSKFFNKRYKSDIDNKYTTFNKFNLTRKYNKDDNLGDDYVEFLGGSRKKLNKKRKTRRKY